MTTDMLEFQQKYIEDAGELIAKLESELMGFEQNPDNETSIKELFRVMHTLKGTSGMFGFSRIESLTHLLEDIYDLIRSKKLAINKDIINLTFQSVDILKSLLETKEKLDREQELLYANIVADALKYSEKGLQKIPETIKEEVGNVAFYRVVFKPNLNVLLRGIKPYALIEDLTALGKNIVHQFDDEGSDQENEDVFTKYWEVFLSGTVKLNDIKDVFLFFDDSEFSIDSLNVASPAKVKKFLSDSLSVKNKIPISELTKKVNKLLPKIESKILPVEKEKIAKSQKLENAGVEDTIRVSAAKLDNLLNAVGDLVIIHSQFENHATRIHDEGLKKTILDLSKLSRYFRDEILSTRLIPVAILTTSMQRLVRDVSQKLGKNIELITEGLQTELDKTIISKIENPLMHIIRNCIDHGIETPEERIKHAKDPVGKIRFIAFNSGTSVFIQIQDDGKGIDTKYIFNKAVSKGLVSPHAKLTDKEIYEFIFIPGFSTTQIVSEISGRGVGLDVVKTAVTELHGEINIDSELGLGTSFTFKLPLTLSIVDALLINSSRYKILIPTSNILYCKFIPRDFFRNKEMQYEINNKCVPVKRLSELMGFESQNTEFEVLIIISIYEKYFGLLVDKISSTVQAVIKPLGQFHREQPYFIGASLLGDGSLAYILDTNFFLKIA